jgi:large subunit ribosomal protein L3
MKYLLGTKHNMGQVFRDDGTVIPVTYVHVAPLTVAALRKDAQGQDVAILGSGENRRAAKPQQKEFKDRTIAFDALASVQIAGETMEVGTTITVANFSVGDVVDVVGTSKGRGYQGVVKRHGFGGHPTTHGHKDQVRKSGSIGAGGIQRVFKGMRMAGRMGGDRVTVKNLQIVAIDAENNMLAVKGAVPGAFGSKLTIVGSTGNVWLK